MNYTNFEKLPLVKFERETASGEKELFFAIPSARHGRFVECVTKCKPTQMKWKWYFPKSDEVELITFNSDREFITRFGLDLFFKILSVLDQDRSTGFALSHKIGDLDDIYHPAKILISKMWYLSALDNAWFNENVGNPFLNYVEIENRFRKVAAFNSEFVLKLSESGNEWERTTMEIANRKVFLQRSKPFAEDVLQCIADFLKASVEFATSKENSTSIQHLQETSKNLDALLTSDESFRFLLKSN